MNYKDYNCIKLGSYFSVGKFGEDVYCLENLTGFGFVPVYHKISKEEFDSFNDWRSNKDKVFEIICRPVFCSGYDINNSN